MFYCGCVNVVGFVVLLFLWYCCCLCLIGIDICCLCGLGWLALF